jgi:hypothetical protein
MNDEQILQAIEDLTCAVNEGVANILEAFGKWHIRECEYTELVHIPAACPQCKPNTSACIHLIRRRKDTPVDKDMPIF